MVYVLPIHVDLAVGKMHARFPARRTFGIHRNCRYQSGNEKLIAFSPPGFCWKLGDPVQVVGPSKWARCPAPGLSVSLDFEVGLVVAAGNCGRYMLLEYLARHSHEYAVDTDMTQSAPLDEANPRGQRSSLGTRFDAPTYVDPVFQSTYVPGHSQAELWFMSTEPSSQVTAGIDVPVRLRCRSLAGANHD